MYYVILTVAMLVGNAQPGRIVVSEMDMSAGSLLPIDQSTVPLGARASYMQRGQIEQTLILFHCGAPVFDSGIAITYECQGIY